VSQTPLSSQTTSLVLSVCSVETGSPAKSGCASISNSANLGTGQLYLSFSPIRMSFNLREVAPGASRVLTTCVFGSFFLAKPFRIRMQLIEQGFEFVDVDVQDSLEELPANFLESNLQLRYNSPSPAGRLNNQ
jgi:hypothetical protein